MRYCEYNNLSLELILFCDEQILYGSTLSVEYVPKLGHCDMYTSPDQHLSEILSEAYLYMERMWPVAFDLSVDCWPNLIFRFFCDISMNKLVSPYVRLTTSCKT